MSHFKGFAMMNYSFCSHTKSLLELESAIVATTPYFEHTAPLTYSLWCTVCAVELLDASLSKIVARTTSSIDSNAVSCACM